MLVKNTKNKSLYLFVMVFFGITIFAAGVCWFLFYKKEQQKSPLKIIQSKAKQNTCSDENAEIVIKDLILKEVEKHKGLEVIINASEGKILNSTDKIECKNISCSLNNGSRKIADLRANNAIIHKTTKNIFLSGTTVGHTYDMTVNGNDISYNYSSHMLTTNKEVSYTHKFFSLIAQKSYVDLKNSKIVMSGGVRSEFLNGPAGNDNAD